MKLGFIGLGHMAANRSAGREAQQELRFTDPATAVYWNHDRAGRVVSLLQRLEFCAATNEAV